MKIFISHDSRDKNRFVEKFATRLLDNGIDVWYDDWELGFGDSLMTIFDAISQCDVFISIISEYSVESKWVMEESDSAFIKKIEDNVKFIPVILPGDFEIPNNLHHIVQCRIQDINDYDSEFNKLLSDIFGISLKPKIGDVPRYTLVSPINELEQSDTIVIKVIGDFFIKNKLPSISFDQIVDLTVDFDLTKEDIRDSIEILFENNFIKYTKTFSNTPINIRFTYKGVKLYCENYIDDYNLYIKKIFSSILNDNMMDNGQIIQKTNIPRFIVNAILDCLEIRNYVKLYKTISGSSIIYKVSATGKRYMKRVLNEESVSIQKPEIVLPNCNKKETSIFKELCEYCLDKSFDVEIDPMVIINLVDKYYDEDDFDKLQEKIAFSLRNLEKNNYIFTNGGSIGLAFSSKSISHNGFCFYLKYFLNGKKIYSNVIKGILHDKLSTIGEISIKYSIENSLVDMLIKIFRKNGYIVCNNDLSDITLTPAGEEYFESLGIYY